MNMANAWMIRNDGLEIPVTAHVYGTPENEYHKIDDENTYVATFLIKYGNNTDSFTDALIGKYFTIYFTELLNQGLVPEQYIKELPYLAVFKDLGNNDYLLKLWEKYKDSVSPQTINAQDVAIVNREINHELNQTFLRARIGGEYDTVAGNKDMYFRISSTGFRWNNIIDGFLVNRGELISTVTIERDKEFTGSNKKYVTPKDSPIDHMPLETFFDESEGEIDAPESYGYTNDAICRYGPRMILRQGLREGRSMNYLCANVFGGYIESEAIYDIYAKWEYRENRLNPKW
jgi:hypothetical protein